ncbi:MAG: hypothetical protein Rubg2KO_14120 [Rubricoccaceae bacterium]
MLSTLTRRIGLGAVMALGVVNAQAQSETIEWEHVGFIQAFTVSFLPGPASDGSLDTLVANGLVYDQNGFKQEVVLRRGLSETEWTDVSPRINGRIAEEIAGSCLLIGNSGGPEGIQRTCDRGRSWTSHDWPDGDHIHVECLYHRPSDGAVLGCHGPADDLAISHDSGLTWSLLGAALPGATGETRDLIEHPTAAADGGPRLVVGLLGGYATSDDGGLTWATSTAWPQQQYLPDDIAIDPIDGTAFDGRIYATANDGLATGPREALLASDDGGATWTTLRHFPTGRAQVTVAQNGSVWVGVSSSGTGSVWRSEDGGDTWEDVTGTYSGQPVGYELVQGPDGRMYLAGGFSQGTTTNPGGGVWRTVEPVSVTSGRRPEVESLGLQVHPNPSRQHVELALSGADRQPVGVIVIDAQGREVARTELAAGSSWRLDVSDWAPGVYHARAGDGVEAVAFTVVR